MGFYSWKTGDTKRSIANHHSNRKTFTVHMITPDGQVFTENDYEGYGVFGGKHIYDLVAELNNIPPGKKNDTQLAVIDILFETIITNGEVSFSNKKDFWHWDNDKLFEGKSANQLVSEGWKRIYPHGNGDFKKAAEAGLIMPKLVEKIPEKFEGVPYPTNCPDRGYWY